MKIDNKKLKAHLETILNRRANDNEIENAKSDMRVLLELLSQRVEALENKISP